MAEPAIENPLPVNGESKSARKKKAKAEAASNGNGNGTNPSPAVPAQPSRDDSSVNTQMDSSGTYENPYLKELQKQSRNISKKLSGMQKTDAIIAENAGVSLDELVAQRKINADQKASAEKKPQLQAQVVQLEEQIQTFKKVDVDYQSQLHRQKEDLTAQHEKDMESLKHSLGNEATATGATELRKKMLVFSQFLRAAAAKRNVEEDASTDENMAFEGALLLVYGGDQKAVDTAVSIVEGSDEQVPNIEGAPLPIKCESAPVWQSTCHDRILRSSRAPPSVPLMKLMCLADAQIKQASIDHAPFQTEEAWIDSVAEANGVNSSADAGASAPTQSDPTLVNAGLTELDQPAQTNGDHAEATHEPMSAAQASTGDEGGNMAGDGWDTTAGAAKDPAMDESYEMVPRPNDEVDTPTSGAPATAAAEQKTLVTGEQKTLWSDEPPAYEVGASGNQAGESWDAKAAGDQTDNSWSAGETSQTNGAAAESWADSTADAAEAPSADDGFTAIAARHRGGRGRGGRGDGEFRGGRGGRGRGGFRGDGEFRGRGRGGFRGDRGDRGDFRGRGRGGRGRGEGGPRGDGAPRGS